MVTKIQDGLVTYIGFHANKNKKFIVETKGNWTYINYQKDEFTRIICGLNKMMEDIERIDLELLIQILKIEM